MMRASVLHARRVMMLSACLVGQACTTDFDRFHLGHDSRARDAANDASDIPDADIDGASKDAALDANQSSDSATNDSGDAADGGDRDAAQDSGMDAGPPCAANATIVWPPEGITAAIPPPFASASIRLRTSTACAAGLPSHLVVSYGGRQQVSEWSSGELSVDAFAASTASPDYTLEIYARYPEGDFLLATRNLRRGEVWGSTRGIAVNSAGTRALAADDELQTLFAADLTTSEISVLSSPDRGTGPALSSARDVFINAANTQAYVLNTGSIVSVDLNSGNRSLVTGTGVGTGTALGNTLGFDYDPDNERFLVGDETNAALVSVARSTGNRTTLASGSVGTGTSLINIYDALFVSSSRVLLASVNTGVVDVALPSGNRTILSGMGAGTGPDFTRPYALTLDAARNRLLVTGDTSAGLLAVGLTSGARSFVVPAMPASGPAVNGSAPISRVVGDKLWAQTDDGIVEVNVTTGATKLAASIEVGKGPSFLAREIGVDPVDGSLIAAGSHNIVRIDGAQRTVHANLDVNAFNGVPVLPRVIRPTEVYFASGSNVYRVVSGSMTPHKIDPPGSAIIRWLIDDVARSRLLFGDDTGTITAIALPAETFSTLSSDSVGSGTGLGGMGGAALNPQGTRLVIADSGHDALIEVDLTSGNRTTLAGSSVGLGPAFSPDDVFWADFCPSCATDNDGIYVVDTAARSVLVVDPGNGDRSVIASAEVASQYPVLREPLSIVVHDSIAYVTDSARAAIVAIELEFKERVIVSR